MRSVQVVLRSRSDVKAEAASAPGDKTRLSRWPSAPVDRDVAAAECRGCNRWNAASPGVESWIS